ncbi:MAG TPA: hypothetical protein PL013_12440, partial [Deltaproteobacteria bacterium]|nr:hypothetical protein [Deltaproteobacteria bacterium]
MRSRRTFLAACMVLLFSAPLGAVQAAGPLKEKTIPLIVPTEKYAIFIQSAKNSMDSRHIAVVARKGKKFFV